MPGHPDRHPFVARDRELAVIRDAANAARDGVSQVVVVSGPAGIGKTTLCWNAAARAAGDGVAVAWGRAWGHGGAPPLWPWSSVLTELAGPDAATALGDTEVPARDDAARFARFVAVADLVAARTRQSPVMIVLDDVHLADAAALLLARFVAGSPGCGALTIVLTRRSGADEPAEARRVLVEIERTATSIDLQPFEPGDVADLLTAHGRGAAELGLVPALHRLTGGNPLLIGRALAISSAGDGQAVDYLVSRSLDVLGAEQRDVLALAAVLGMEATTAELTTLVGGHIDDVIDTLARASAAGLVDVDATGWRFTHDLVRTAAAEVLTAGETIEAHARARDLVPAESGPAASSRRAHHAIRAASRSRADAERAVGECRTAARALGHSFDYERAAMLLGTAVELHEQHDLTDRVGIVLEWADALLVCGRLEDARRAYGRAVDAAEQADDWASRARAALGLGGVWVNEHRSAVDRRRVLDLQRSALAELPGGADVLRARLVVRLAAEAVYDGAAVEPVLAALDRARGIDDDHALAEALSLTHHALLAPEHLDRRLGIADELVTVAARCGDELRVLFGLLWKSVDQLLAGDATAERTLSELRTRAHAVGCRSIGYVVAAIDVMRLIRSGRLLEAEDAAHECFELGVEVGDADATGYYGAHLLTIRWLQGRDGELLDLAREIAGSSTLVEPEFAYRAGAAAIAARAGLHDDSKSMLGNLVDDGLASLPRSSTWLTGIANLIETAAVLTDRDLAREAYELLQPFADRPVMPSLAITCFGSAQRALGLAALTYGDLDAAAAHLERAVSENVRFGNRPLAAMTRADLAAALLARDRPGDRAAAERALVSAAEAAASMGMDRRAGEWTDLATSITSPGDPAVLRRDGDRWLLGTGSDEVELPDLVGVGYLGTLLDRPGEEVSALELCGGADLVGASHDLIDQQTLQRYRHRVGELDAQLDAARRGGPHRLVQRLEREREALRDELSSVVGRAGRPRRFADPSERARTAVRKAITRAIDVIADTRPDLADDLRASVTTGRTCAYRPDTGRGRRWLFVGR